MFKEIFLAEITLEINSTSRREALFLNFDPEVSLLMPQTWPILHIFSCLAPPSGITVADEDKLVTLS